jgi:pSer/pThr/pTyr-binding forkhead associated (FHA) protein
MGGVSANPPAGAQPPSELQARLEAERAGQAFLVYKDGQGRQQRWSLEPGMAQVSVGRLESSDLRLDWDEGVSRLHARFERSGEDWSIVDDSSRNGTFVNGERVGGRRRLRDGDSLRFGATTVTFHAPRPAEQAAPVPDAEAPSGLDLSTTQRRVLAALCRPYKGGSVFASPVTDEHLAAELFLPVKAVHKHLAVLFAKFGVDELPKDERRVRLVERAIHWGVISESDL